MIAASVSSVHTTIGNRSQSATCGFPTSANATARRALIPCRRTAARPTDRRFDTGCIGPGTASKRALVSICGNLLLLAASLYSLAASAQSVGVTLRIHMDADSVEIIKSWRRAQGLDPADVAADRHVRQILESNRASRLPGAETHEAARLRRMARTVELVSFETALTSAQTREAECGMPTDCGN